MSGEEADCDGAEEVFDVEPQSPGSENKEAGSGVELGTKYKHWASFSK
eukprot:gene18306-5823_t